MLLLNWRIGYIMNAASVCKYIRSYVICKQLQGPIYYFEVSTDNDPKIQ